MLAFATATAYKIDTHTGGGWGHPDSGKDMQGDDANNAWIVHPDENAWLASDTWTTTRPEDERLQYVDMLSDIIPFWLQEVAAAERGEKLRYDQFLADLQAERERRFCVSEWGLPVPGWAADSPTNETKKKFSNTDQSNNSGELKRSGHDRNTDEGAADEIPSETSLDRDDFNFVEKVARLNGINPAQKRQMRRFYKVS